MKGATIGFGLVIMGVAVFGYTLMHLVEGAALDEQAKVPGTFVVSVEEAGRHYVWDNHWTRFEGEHLKYDADCPSDGRVVVRDGSGVEVAFTPDSSQGWSVGNNGRKSVGYVEVSGATELEFVVDGVGQERIFSVSNRTVRRELWSRLGGLGVGVALVFLGSVVAFVSFVVGRRDPKGGVEVEVANEGERSS